MDDSRSATSLPSWTLALGLLLAVVGGELVAALNSAERACADTTADYVPAVQYTPLLGRRGEYLGYRSVIEGSATEAEAEAKVIQARVQEALSRYGVPPGDIRLARSGDGFELSVSLENVRDMNLRHHLAYHAQRLSLRETFSRLEAMGHRARDMFLELKPAQADIVMRNLSPEDFMVINQWHKNNEARRPPVHVNELLGCP